MSRPPTLAAHGTHRFPSLDSYVVRGTTPFQAPFTGLANQAAHFAAPILIDALRARPFVVNRRAVADQISFQVSTGGGAGSVGRVGIYRNTSPRLLYPSSLVVDSGSFDCTVASVKIASINVPLNPGLYWFVFLFGVNNPTCYATNPAAIPPLLPMSSALGQFNNIAVAYGPFGALPDPFPAGAVGAGNNVPAAGLRFV